MNRRASPSTLSGSFLAPLVAEAQPTPKVAFLRPDRCSNLPNISTEVARLGGDIVNAPRTREGKD
jgi:hypothetical protein